MHLSISSCLNHVYIIYYIDDSIFIIIISFLSNSLFLYTASNFAERFNDTLIWYSFNRAPSNFTPSPKHFAPSWSRLRSSSLSIVISRRNICNLDRTGVYIATGTTRYSVHPPMLRVWTRREGAPGDKCFGG